VGTVKGDLPLRDLPTDIGPAATGSNVLSIAGRAGRAARSLIFLSVYFSYLLLVMEPLHWLAVGPLLAFQPSRRRARLRSWIRLQTRVMFAMARILAGLRISVHGAIEATSCIVVMNHQSIFDIPIGLSLIAGPYPLIPTRASYRKGIPGVSSLLRLMRCPLLDQGNSATRSELLALREAADQVERGEQSLLIYPEGHRSRNGMILPFMKPGLRLMLRRASSRPVYVVVCDGLGHLRSFTETALGLAGSRVQVAILGPYNTPATDVERDRFLDGLRQDMIQALAALREAQGESPRLVAHHRLAR
jgi:1-acyl-sn-glycerol-3-phosphate acyltransferase